MNLNVEQTVPTHKYNNFYFLYTLLLVTLQRYAHHASANAFYYVNNMTDEKDNHTFS